VLLLSHNKTQKKEVIAMKKTNKILSFLLALLMVFSIIPATSITSSATDGYYELSYDGYYMDIYNNPYDVDVPSSVEDIYISDTELNESLELDNGKVNKITFRNCTINMDELGSFKKLDSLIFINCEFEDLTFLSKNKNMSFLDLDSCYMSSLNGIQYLPNLESLYVYDVGVESIDFLRHNKKLVELSLYNTCVTDLSPIENMNIEYLDISNTLSIRDLSPVMTLDNLCSFISINCEMAYTQELCNFLKKNFINNNVSKEWKNIQASVKNIADEIFTDDMTEEEIIEETIWYVVDKMEYDFRIYEDDDLSWEYNQRALGYALEGIGVCKNYSALATVLLQEAGILVYEIKSFDHIWNIVKLDDGFYWIDPTWLDGLSRDEMKESPYYMNNNYEFDDHIALTIPCSMYDNEYVPEVIFAICAPTKTTIRYMDGIILHTTFEDGQLDGNMVRWSANNDNFEIEYNDDSTITIISDSNGYTYFTAELIDEEGNVLATDVIEIRSKAGLFARIGGFFRMIFNATQIYDR
jgi:internalin A